MGLSAREVKRIESQYRWVLRSPALEMAQALQKHYSDIVKPLSVAKLAIPQIRFIDPDVVARAFTSPIVNTIPRWFADFEKTAIFQVAESAKKLAQIQSAIFAPMTQAVMRDFTRNLMPRIEWPTVKLATIDELQLRQAAWAGVGTLPKPTHEVYTEELDALEAVDDLIVTDEATGESTLDANLVIQLAGLGVSVASLMVGLVSAAAAWIVLLQNEDTREGAEAAIRYLLALIALLTKFGPG